MYASLKSYGDIIPISSHHILGRCGLSENENSLIQDFEHDLGVISVSG